MTITLPCGARSGCVRIPASKSQAHRLLICAALSKEPVRLLLRRLNDDISATAQCLRALGAQITEEDGALAVLPIREAPKHALLDVGESGSTLRFLLPVLGALGVDAEIRMHGRLPERPQGPLLDCLTEHGMSFLQEGSSLFVSGTLRPGSFAITGGVSSQFISGLLFALPLLAGDSTLRVDGALQSARYVRMTQDALTRACIRVGQRGACLFEIPGRQQYRLSGEICVEGDWSGAAPFLCMGALSAEGVTVEGLDMDSLQADRMILDVLRAFGAEVRCQDGRVLVRKGHLRGITIDAAQIPDCVPPLGVLAACAEGHTSITHAERLRLKESDRLLSTASVIQALGGCVRVLPDGLEIEGACSLRGGSVDAAGDHRIAMSAALAACAAAEPVVLSGSSCVSKSYPDFWTDYFALKGETR